MTSSESHPDAESTSSLLLKVKVYRELHIQFLLLTGSVSGAPVRSVTLVVDLSRMQLHVSRHAGSPATSASDTFAATGPVTAQRTQLLANIAMFDHTSMAIKLIFFTYSLNHTARDVVLIQPVTV